MLLTIVGSHYNNQATLFGQYRRIIEEEGEAKEDEKEEVKELYKNCLQGILSK